MLDEDQLRKLIEGFRGSAMFPIVAVAAFTGARHKRTITIDDGLVARLCGEREKYLRLLAGVGSSASVDLRSYGYRPMR